MAFMPDSVSTFMIATPINDLCPACASRVCAAPLFALQKSRS
jgi:hypothetical protein